MGKEIGRLFGSVIWNSMPSSILGKLAVFIGLSVVGIVGLVVASVVGTFGFTFYILRKMIWILTCKRIGGTPTPGSQVATTTS